MSEFRKPNELRLVRVYEAPLAAVWDAWTDPEQVSKWWGPRGFTITSHSKDLRPGGTWRYTMHGPDGVDYPNVTLYHEVVERERLVYDHGGSDDRPPLFRVTALFSEADGKTTLDMTMAFATPEAAEECAAFIKRAGGESTWDRLAEHLAELGGEKPFVICRSFEAPIDDVFSAWTDPGRIARWLPPTGFAVEFLRCDIRAGGESFYRMANDAGIEMFGKSEYLEVTRPSRVVYRQQFSDAQGNVGKHPLAPVWPDTMLVVVSLTSEGPRRTRVRIVTTAAAPYTAEELAAFAAARAGMTQGWSGSFERLEGELGKDRGAKGTDD